MAVIQTSDKTAQVDGELIHYTSFADKNLNGWSLEYSSTLEVDYFCCLKKEGQQVPMISLELTKLPGFSVGKTYIMSFRARRKGGSVLDAFRLEGHPSMSPRAAIIFNGLSFSWKTYSAGFLLTEEGGTGLVIQGWFESDDVEIHIDDIRFFAVD